VLKVVQADVSSAIAMIGGVVAGVQVLVAAAGMGLPLTPIDNYVSRATSGGHIGGHIAARSVRNR